MLDRDSLLAGELMKEKQKIARFMMIKDEKQARMFKREHLIEKRMKEQEKKYKSFEKAQRLKQKEKNEKFKEWQEKHE